MQTPLQPDLDHAPLTAVAFASLMDALSMAEGDAERLAVAVSGGADSLCLVRLAHDWAAARDKRVLALIVDHGLRSQSAGERSWLR